MIYVVCKLYPNLEKLTCSVFSFRVQDLLQLQYEGVAVMKMFDKAKVNVNLLIFLLNKKFYGKWAKKTQNKEEKVTGVQGRNRLCLLTVQNESSHKTWDGVEQCFVSSDCNLMDHTKMKCCYSPTKCYLYFSTWWL